MSMMILFKKMLLNNFKKLLFFYNQALVRPINYQHNFKILLVDIYTYMYLDNILHNCRMIIIINA